MKLCTQNYLVKGTTLIRRYPIVHHHKVEITQIFAQAFSRKRASLIFYERKLSSFSTYLFYQSRNTSLNKRRKVLIVVIIFSRPSYFATIFIAPSSRSLSLVSRETLLFFSRAKLLFHDCRFREQRLADFRKVCLPIFARALSLRRIIVTVSRVLGAIEKIDERRDEWGGVRKKCLARKKTRQSRSTPINDDGGSIGGRSSSFSTSRSSAVFLALFNNRALSGRDMLRSYHAFLPATFIRKRFLSDRVNETFAITGE